jgi:hypothetical protein
LSRVACSYVMESRTRNPLTPKEDLLFDHLEKVTVVLDWGTIDE